MKGIEKASLGIRYLIKYNETQDPSYFDLIKLYTSEIRFWCVLTMFCNNMDSLFNEIPDYLLKDVFTMQPIERAISIVGASTTCYDYGKGFTSNSLGDYRKELRILRNSLAHGDFTFDGEMIQVKSTTNNYEAVFDLKWFMSLALCTLSDGNYRLQKKMSDVSLISLVNQDFYSTRDIKDLIEDDKIVFVNLTAMEDDAKKMIEELNLKGIEEERFTFDLLKLSLLNKLQQLMLATPGGLSSENLKRSLVQNMKIAMMVFKGYMKMEIVKPEFSILEDSEFQKLELNSALQFLENSIVSQDKTRKKTIELNQILDILDKLDKDIPLDPNDIFLLSESQEYLLSVYGNILFSGLKLSRYPKKNELEIFFSFADRFSFDFPHARRIWKEYIRRIKNTIVALKSANTSFYKRQYYEKMLLLYEKKLGQVLDGEEHFLLFSAIRNAFTHGYVDIKDKNVLLYDQEPTIKIWRVSSKTGDLTSTDFSEKGHTFEFITDEDTLMAILDTLYANRGVKINTNVAKFCKRVRKHIDTDQKS